MLTKIFKGITILFLIIIISSGCIAFHPEYAIKDQHGFYIKHFEACGPRALEKALNNLGENVNRRTISKQIQLHGNLSRTSISLIHYEGILITWPGEVKKILTRYGYKIIKLKSLSDLKDGDTAIVLIKGKTLKYEFHWSCYPLDKDLNNFYPNGTTILKIYKIVPK